MIGLKLLFCADSASLDSRYNTVSAFHIVESFQSATFPAFMNRVTIIGMLSRDENDAGDIEVQLQVLLGGQELFVRPLPLAFGPNMLARAVVEVQGLVIPAPGSLVVCLRHGDVMLGSWTIQATQVGQPHVQLALPSQPQNQ